MNDTRAPTLAQRLEGAQINGAARLCPAPEIARRILEEVIKPVRRAS